MQASCDIAFEYAHIRKQFGQPIGKFQVILIHYKTDLKLSLKLENS